MVPVLYKTGGIVKIPIWSIFRPDVIFEVKYVTLIFANKLRNVKKNPSSRDLRFHDSKFRKQNQTNMF